MSFLRRRLDLWLPGYLLAAPARALARRERRGRTTHVLFLICDHYEPRHGATTPEQPMERVRTWRREYRAFQARCRNAFGHAPRHSWFYPPHHGPEPLPELAHMVCEGQGEAELHYHHDHDTEATLRRDLTAAIAEYQRWGLLLASGEPPATAFGFIHGDWALCNAHGNGGRFCGVNDELSILSQLGCWGDLTMPSADACQTRRINAVYYAGSSPARPKSHDWGRLAQAGRPAPAGLWLMQGPLGINWRGPRYPRIENAALTTANWGRPDRVDAWLDCNVHVKGRPEWVFVKLHAHGAVERDFDALFGERAFRMHADLNDRYNDGTRFRLHYVTAREAHNIALAAEAGHAGDPMQYRDFRVPPPANAWYAADVPHRLVAATASRVALEGIEALHARVQFAHAPAEAVSGALSAVHREGGALTVTPRGQAAEIALDLAPRAPLPAIAAGRVLSGGPRQLRIHAEPGCRIVFPSTEPAAPAKESPAWN